MRLLAVTHRYFFSTLVLQQLEKRRAHAEKVFVENEKRSKVALEKLRTEAKQEEKHEEAREA